MGVASRLFYKIGHFSATHTFIVIAIALICIGICCIGFHTLVVTVTSTQNSPQKLWVDPGSQTNHEQTYFNHHFGKFFRVEQINFVAKQDPDNTDLFQKEYLAEVWDLQSQIEAAETLFENRVYTVDFFCYKPVDGEGCYISSPMDYWKMNITAMQDDPDIKYTAQCTQQVAGEEIVCSDRNQIPIIREVVFGGIKCLSGSTTGCEACKITAKMLTVTILLNNNDETKRGAEYWETHVMEAKINAFNADDSRLLRVHYMAERSISDELNHETR